MQNVHFVKPQYVNLYHNVSEQINLWPLFVLRRLILEVEWNGVHKNQVWYDGMP